MKRITLFLITVLSAAMIFTGCAQPNNTASSTGTADEKSSSKQAFQIIAADEAKKMMDEGNVTIIDVRRKDEYDAGHIKDAILISNESIGDTAPAELPDKDAVLLVYCRTGIRAKEASQKLADLGYTHVYDFGGITDWPYDIVK
ncbi:MAG: rhodanese-like domain-containing protein [Christensenella sp.]|nr:rhodanese-like domain-containing protein [Christensenella sp.]